MSHIILLPPSEGKSIGGRHLKRTALTLKSSPLLAERHEMLTALQDTVSANNAAGGSANQKLFGVKGEALERAVSATLDLESAPVLPALDRYTGVLYDALDVPSFSNQLLKYANESIFIFSGLFGVVHPDEMLPDYRLKMGATLPTIGKVSTWWRPHVTAWLTSRTADKQVWNLLPQEHDAAWAPATQGYAPSNEIRVKFLIEEPNGSWRVVNHWNKLLKGALVRFLLENPTAQVEDLIGWDHPEGYRLDLNFTMESPPKLESWQRELYFVKRQ